MNPWGSCYAWSMQLMSVDWYFVTEKCICRAFTILWERPPLKLTPFKLGVHSRHAGLPSFTFHWDWSTSHHIFSMVSLVVQGACKCCFFLEAGSSKPHISSRLPGPCFSHLPSALGADDWRLYWWGVWGCGITARLWNHEKIYADPEMVQLC